MFKIVRQLSKHWMICIIVFGLLFIQAQCDLNLPSMTSDIVDTGIQMGGVESTIPETIRPDTLTALEWLMSEKDAELVEASFGEEKDGLRTLSVERNDELEEIFKMPDIMLYMMAGQGGQEVDSDKLDEAVKNLNQIPSQMKEAAKQLQSLEEMKNNPQIMEGLKALKAMPPEQLEMAISMGMVQPEQLQLAIVLEVMTLDDLPESIRSQIELPKQEETQESPFGVEMGEDFKQLLLDYDGSDEGMREIMQELLGDILSQIDDSTLEIMASQAMLLVRVEYKAQDISEKVQMNYLIKAGAKMLGFTLILASCAIAVGFLASRVSATIGKDLREKVFRKVVSYSNAEIDKFSTASLITRTTNDIQQVQFVCVMLLRMVCYAPIIGIGGIIKVAKTGSDLTWIIALTVASLLVMIIILMIVAMPKFKLVQTLVDKLNQVGREILTGIMPIRAFSREKHEESRFEEANTNLMKNQLFTGRTMAAMMPFMTIIMNGCSLLIVWFGGKAMDLGTMQVGDMIAYITYTMQIVMSFMMIAMVAILLPRAGVAADRIYEVLDTDSSVHDPKSISYNENKTWTGQVEFKNVHFRYPGGESDALEDINFVANPGETTAIIGSTGCGKSTVLNLIPRFFDVTQGSVTIDGVDVRDMKQSTLRDLLGYVPQKGVLFSGTIESNLKFAGDEVDDDMMKTAAEVAQASSFIEQKSKQYSSPIAQGGTNVSGGQKQRLSIARAIAKNPKIYLFDDSFSALDFKTDVALRKALNKRTHDATVIIVAQRISTVLHANQIIVLDEGRIVGKGTHNELMESCEEYREIAKSQLSQKELGGVE